VIADDDAAREPFDRAARTTPAEYGAHTGSEFRATTSGGTITLRLASLSAGRVVDGFEQFSLFFHGPADALLQQGIYILEHDRLGALALFLVPILGSNRERIVYEACFNRPVMPEAGAEAHTR